MKRDASWRESLGLYASLGGLALVSRLTIAVWPAQPADPSQGAVLRWPIFASVLALGFPVMHLSHRWGVRREVDDSPLAAGVWRAVASGLVFALALIAWDVVFVLPPDLNVLGAVSVPFYVAGAFVVEVILHLIPLVLWLGVMGRLVLRGRRGALVFWIGAALVAALEPVSQFGGGVFEGYSLAFFLVGAAVSYVANLWQLALFRRGGLAPMLGFRIGFYLLWHVVWGLLRLRLLF